MKEILSNRRFEMVFFLGIVFGTYFKDPENASLANDTGISMTWWFTDDQNSMKLVKSYTIFSALLDIEEDVDPNDQWSGYKTALGNYLANALILSLGRSMKSLASILKTAKNKPIVKTNVILNQKVLSVSIAGKDMCLFLDSFKRYS